MKKNRHLFKALKHGIVWIWQLPQNLLGLWLMVMYSNWIDCKALGFEGFNLYYLKRVHWAVSLGSYIFVPVDCDVKTVRHEIGHHHQSKLLGPLYLIVIGIPSLIWNVMFRKFRKKHNISYYSFYTEKWADKIKGIER